MRPHDIAADKVSQILVDVAQAIVLPHFGALRAEDITEKRPGDLVTVADRQAEAAITRQLSSLTPQALIVGEEQTFFDHSLIPQLATAAEAWVVDPIDGTRNYARTSPDFAMMVAHIRAGRVVESWIYQPVHQLLYQAERGAGVCCNGEPVRRIHHRTSLVGATSRKLTSSSAEVVLRHTWGACGIDYPKLVMGEIDFLIYREGNPWDHLPACLMVEELGGRMASRDGVDYSPGITEPPLTVIPAERWPLVNASLHQP